MTGVFQSEPDADYIQFLAAKIATGRYFLARILPEADAHLAKLKTGAEPLMTLPADAF